MQPTILATAPRCGARTRLGQPCRAPAISGHRRCRMHGGKGSGAPRGNRNSWKHGIHSGWIAEVRRYLRATYSTRVRDGDALPCAVPKRPTEPRPERKNKNTNEQPHAPRIFANSSQQTGCGRKGRGNYRRGHMKRQRALATLAAHPLTPSRSREGENWLTH